MYPIFCFSTSKIPIELLLRRNKRRHVLSTHQTFPACVCTFYVAELNRTKVSSPHAGHAKLIYVLNEDWLQTQTRNPCMPHECSPLARRGSAGMDLDGWHGSMCWCGDVLWQAGFLLVPELCEGGFLMGAIQSIKQKPLQPGLRVASLVWMCIQLCVNTEKDVWTGGWGSGHFHNEKMALGFG